MAKLWDGASIVWNRLVEEQTACLCSLFVLYCMYLLAYIYATLLTDVKADKFNA